MTRDYQQRWARAYEKARRRTKRRVDQLLTAIEVAPDGGTQVRHADALLGEADLFEDRVHGLLLRGKGKR